MAKLIIVDDEPVILELLLSIFEESPLQAVGCSDGRSAMAEIERGVDLLLTDKNLPDHNGLELVRFARERVPDVEAIIITGYASLDTALEAMQLDVFDYIIKPPRDIFDVRRKVEQAAEKQRLSRENARLLAEVQQKNARLARQVVELTDLQSELFQAEKLAGIGTLAAGFAHEVRSPLFGMVGLAEAIDEEDDLKLIHGYAKEIIVYGGVIRDVVAQLSDYSRDAIYAEPEHLCLNEMVDDAVRLVRLATHWSGEVVRTVDPMLTVCGKASEFQQVLVNVIKNAVEAVAGRPQARVGVTVREVRPQEVVLWIWDEGPGIEPAGWAKVFDPFYTTKPTGEGTGLGLNIVYRIVTRFGGSARIVEGEASGATFEITFPRAV